MHGARYCASYGIVQHRPTLARHRSLSAHRFRMQFWTLFGLLERDRGGVRMPSPGLGISEDNDAFQPVSMVRPLVKLLRLNRHCIYEQLKLEEALLRASGCNWCVLNDGAAQSAVVMGISGKPEELLHLDQVKKRDIQVIRRFSGGGTVVVDENTLFATFIFNQREVDGVEPFPHPIMHWTAMVYNHVFPVHTSYRLQENDYVFGEKKIGGNAQSIIKDRWLHHTSFLWDYQPDNMALLKNPSRQPDYRKDRTHTEFVTKMRDHLRCRREFMDGVVLTLERIGYEVEESDLSEADHLLSKKYLRNTVLVEPGMLDDAMI